MEGLVLGGCNQLPPPSLFHFPRPPSPLLSLRCPQARPPASLSLAPSLWLLCPLWRQLVLISQASGPQVSLLLRQALSLSLLPPLLLTLSLFPLPTLLLPPPGLPHFLSTMAPGGNFYVSFSWPAWGCCSPSVAVPSTRVRPQGRYGDPTGGWSGV